MLSSEALAKLPAAALAWWARWARIRSAIGAPLLLVVVMVGGFLWAIHRPLDFGEQVWVIKPGDTLSEVAAQLVEREVIAQTLVLKLLARHNNLGRQIRAGEYRFPPATSLNEFLQRIVSGKSQIGIKVTIIEGWTFRQMRAHLRKETKLKQVTAAISDQQLMAKLGHPDLHPEGQFFPDTYAYHAGQTDLSIYREAFQLMQKKLALAWENRATNLPLTSPYQALVMASIIEKESWVVDERPTIAGVFYNRLAKKMRLQTDPTVIYGLGANFNGNLTRAHLKADTPYNTYTRRGLPPTPISLPSSTSIAAATRPGLTGAYYFVASGGGRHHFSVTLDEHNKAVWKYIRSKKQ